MKRFAIKDASAFPARSYRDHLAALRQGKCVEIRLTPQDDAIKLRRSIIASIRRWLTTKEQLKTAIRKDTLSLLVVEKTP